MSKKGIKQAKKGDFTKALYYFEKSADTDTSNMEALVLKATALSDLGRYGESEALFLSLIEKNHETTDLYYNLSLLYFDEEQYDKALEYINKAIFLDSSVADNFTHKAEILVETGKHDEAMPLVSLSLSLKRKDYAANLLMSEIYYYHGDYTEAEKHAKTALKDDSRFYGAYLILYRIYSKMNDKEKACANYRQAIKRGVSWAETDGPGMIKCE